MAHSHPSTADFFPGDNPALLKTLQTKPVIALPTLVLFLVSWLVFLLITWATLIPHWLPTVTGAVLAALCGYALFSPIHDSLHRSVSKHEWLNDLVGIGVLFLMVPYSPYKLLRWGHMQHHRFTNEKGADPDKFLTDTWHAPLTTWMFFELFYLPSYWRHRHERPREEVIQVFAQLTLGLAWMALAFWWTGAEFFLYWLVASRTTLWLIVAVFVFLPHQPFTVLQKERPYQATLLRKGWHWLLTPAMAYQNWHLVHHLYPTVPFYRYRQAWLAREAFHESKGPIRVSTFQLQPRPDQLPPPA